MQSVPFFLGQTVSGLVALRRARETSTFKGHLPEGERKVKKESTGLAQLDRVLSNREYEEEENANNSSTQDSTRDSPQCYVAKQRESISSDAAGSTDSGSAPQMPAHVAAAPGGEAAGDSRGSWGLIGAATRDDLLHLSMRILDAARNGRHARGG